MIRYRLKLISIIALSFYTLTGLSQKGYEIQVKIPALKDSTIILAHYFVKDNSFLPDDTIVLDKKGVGIFKGQQSLTGGMYIIYLPTKRYIDVLIGKNQVFKIEADTSDLLKGIKFQGSLENKLFYEYRNLISTNEQAVSKLNDKKNILTSESQKDSISHAIDMISQEVSGYIDKTIKAYPDLYFSTWLKSLQEIEIPEPPRDSEGNILDSTFQYRFYHKHYFDNFDLADARLLNTPFYERKVKTYLEKVIPMHPDSIIKEIDMILGKVNPDKKISPYMLGMLYNHYASLANEIVGMDAVFIYFAEKYYLPGATWTDDKFKEKLKKQISKIKPLLLGKTAPNYTFVEIPSAHFELAKTDTALKSNPYVGTPIDILNIKARFLVIVFWEVDCSHCKKAIPLLYDSIYPKIKEKGARVITIQAISSVEGKQKWTDFVNEHKMYNWINAWSPYSNDYRNLYDILSFPTIYILDENKRIISKRIGVEQIESVINYELSKSK